jgi:hypothetical protein
MCKLVMPLSLLMVFFFCSAFKLKLDSDSHKFTKEYQTSSGVVSFDHEAHAMGRAKDCNSCHSALKTFGGEVSELLAHNYCKTCHEANDGPTECNGCHGQNKVVLK